MTSKDFVACLRKEKDDFLHTLTSGSLESEAQIKIASLKLNADQQQIFSSAIDDILTDVFYSLILGLDGAASIGGVQQHYEIRDEKGDVISTDGELESEAWEQFHNKSA